MRDALLFDLDGTMADTDPIHEAVFTELWQRLGLSVAPGFYGARVQGRANREVFAEFLPGRTDHATLSAEKEAAFRRALPRPYPATPGLEALLERTATADWHRAVVTNAPPANAEAMLGALGLTRHFAVVVTAADSPRPKPDPAPYQEAMRRLGVTPDRAIAFEDSLSGIRAARRSGAYTVAICPAGSRPDLARDQRQAGAHLTITDFTDPALQPLLGAA